MTDRKRRLPAEWEPQEYVLITWPTEHTDWADTLDEVQACYAEIISTISRYQAVVIVSSYSHKGYIMSLLEAYPHKKKNIRLVAYEYNDTWIRDYGVITIFDKDKSILQQRPYPIRNYSKDKRLFLDFRFNGWGLKYPADKDNLFVRNHYQLVYGYEQHQDFVLEGGSIDSNGEGMILTTASCLFSYNRNEFMTEREIKTYLSKTLGAKGLLVLKHGELMGDDTDGHIDTLARFCAPDIIAYVQCQRQSDPHYDSLLAMEKELKRFRRKGKPYQLLPLPLPEPIYYKGIRRPATYANFLIINDAVLVPTYGQPQNDYDAIGTLQAAFPERKVIGIDCCALIKQGGSLHCATMQVPAP
ncbi:MAG: agmatine deiminase family protein [Prevotellaceae bacterium]|jgi:agmatine/peptidylarginine deiminase|nr:agmatine deiminase family protein [Prevotellaceae bacterium]